MFWWLNVIDGIPGLSDEYLTCSSPGIISHETPPPRSQAAGAGAGGGHPGDSSGKSQPTSPSPSVSHKNSSVSKHNYETSRSVPRSFKRHEARQQGLQPPDAAKTRDEGRGEETWMFCDGDQY